DSARTCYYLLLSVVFLCFLICYVAPLHLHSFPTRRSSDLMPPIFRSMPFSPPPIVSRSSANRPMIFGVLIIIPVAGVSVCVWQRSEEHTSELQSRENLVCRLLPEKKQHN